MKNKLCIYGAGGHAKVVAELAELVGFTEIVFCVDNKQESLLWNYQIVPHINMEGSCIIAIGDNQIRKVIAEDIELPFLTLIHPHSWVSPRSVIGCGSVVMAGSSINCDSAIGKHCIINTNSSVDHECLISDYVHISPNVALAGNVFIGEGAHIGIGACVIQGINIGRNSVIGAGAVVIKDVPDGAIVVGNPARVIKFIN